MRTMPAVLASSVVVVSADRAHRMQRSTSTEAMGRGLASILAEDEETSESEDEAEAKLWLAMRAAAGIFWGIEVEKLCWIYVWTTMEEKQRRFFPRVENRRWMWRRWRRFGGCIELLRLDAVLIDCRFLVWPLYSKSKNEERVETRVEKMRVV